MSYEKTVWSTGDTITSEKLNHLEEGVEEAANKPVAPPGNIVNITNNSSDNPIISGSGLVTPTGINGESYSSPSGNSKLFLYNDFIGDGYVVRIVVTERIDRYSVVVNNTPLAFDDRAYEYAFSQSSETAPITGQTYNVVIADKV